MAGRELDHDYRLAVTGLRLRNFSGGGRVKDLGAAFYVEHVLSVCAHVLCLVLPLAWALIVPVRLQFRHGKLSGYAAADDGDREQARRPRPFLRLCTPRRRRVHAAARSRRRRGVTAASTRPL